MDEEIVSGGVEKEENGYTCQPEIRPAVFSHCFLSLRHARAKKVHSCLPSLHDGNLVRQGGFYRSHGSGDRGAENEVLPSEVSVGYYGAAQHVRAMRSETLNRT